MKMTYNEILGRVYIPYATPGNIPLAIFKTLHKEYWTIISQLILEDHDLFKPTIYSSITNNRLDICHSCFACEYARRVGHYERCDFCPIKIWREQFISNPDRYDATCEWYFNENPYIKYLNLEGSDNYELKSKLAFEIAHLEWEDIMNQ